MGLASPVSQNQACPQSLNQQRFVFPPRPGSGTGTSVIYDVVDTGASVNAAGAIGSSAGTRVGQIRWDDIFQRWHFVRNFSINSPLFSNQGPDQPNIWGPDLLQIQNFVLALDGANPQAPAADGVGDVTPIVQ